MLFESEEIPSAEIYSFYLNEATQGIHSGSPVTRTKCLSILSYFTRIDVEPILPLILTIKKLAKSSDYWELKGQILILCSNALLYFNTVAVEPRVESAAQEQIIAENSHEGSPDKLSDKPSTAKKGGAGSS